MLQNIHNTLSSFLTKLISTIFSLLKVLIQARAGISLPAGTKNTCYILGNGPSLKESLETNHKLLAASELHVVNGFALSPYYKTLKPQNYVFLDQYFTGYDGKNTPIPTVQKTYEHLIADTSWPLNLFVPAATRKNPFWRELTEKNHYIKVIYYNYVIFRGFEAISYWFFKHNLAMPQCQNILAASIFLTINRGYEKVIIYGADHSWHEQLIVDENNVVSTLDKHFYNTSGTEVNLKQRVKKAESYGVHAYFASLSKAFYSYFILSRYAAKRGVKILNASIKSYIDAFERVNTEQQTDI
ncbi:hypothetical protein [Arcticibacter tournemirensis]